LDAWDHRYVYHCPGNRNTNGFDLYSCGLDGKSFSNGDDPDDINNWNPQSPIVTKDPDELGGEVPGIVISAGIAGVVGWAFWKGYRHRGRSLA